MKGGNNEALNKWRFDKETNGSEFKGIMDQVTNNNGRASDEPNNYFCI